jgi:hypothetical protein
MIGINKVHSTKRIFHFRLQLMKRLGLVGIIILLEKKMHKNI